MKILDFFENTTAGYFTFAFGSVAMFAMTLYIVCVL